MKNHSTEKPHTFVQCLHGHRLPVFPMSDKGTVTYVIPRTKFTISVVEMGEQYRFGVTLLLKGKDEYNKKIGREIAEGRAVKQPCLVLNKKDFTRDEIKEIMFYIGYSTTNVSKDALRKWVRSGFIFVPEKMKKIALEGGKTIPLTPEGTW